jgi:hypothetical protein
VRALARLIEDRFGIAWTFVPESPDVYCFLMHSWTD